MNYKSGTFSLLWMKGKEDSLASEAILALVLAVVSISLVLPLASG